MLLVAFFLCLVAPGRTKPQDSSSTTQDTASFLPPYLKICHKSDPKLNECIKSAVEIVKPYLKQGIPELKLPSCEPLILPEIVINQGKGSVTVQSKFNDLQVHGPTDFQLQQVKVDLEKHKLKVKVSIPKLEMKGQYSITGKILMLPIAGSGVFKGNYSNIEAVAIMSGEQYEKNGQTFIEIKQCYISFSIGHATVHLSNLFDGDKQLGDSMNEFLNDNWKNVSDEMMPVLEDTVGNLMKSMASKVFDEFPLDVLLPP